FYSSAHLRPLPSFPTRRSSDLATALRERLEARGDVTLCSPGSPDETHQCAADALRGNYDLIVAAGGDGTVHAVVNGMAQNFGLRSEEHTSELQSRSDLVCRLLL